jgi:hypothetical protein
MKIIIHVSRLDWGVFSGREGDIAAAYSAPALAGCGEGKGISTFRHDGKLWTVGGHCGSWLAETADAYELIPAEGYAGADSAPYSYEGRTVTHKGRKYRLGHKTEFVAADRTVAEWCVHLRQAYEHGGYFTSGKTYHDRLRADLEREVWDVPTRSYVRLTGNVVAAIKLELAKPNFDKHNQLAESVEPIIQPDLLGLPAIDPAAVRPVAVRKDWRQCFR